MALHYFRYHNTNCFFLNGKGGKILAFDAGWPCSLHEYGRMMKSVGLRFQDLAWAFVSHMHMDHAGLLGEFAAAGIECFVFPGQYEAIDDMERTILKNKEYESYKKIDKSRLRKTTLEDFTVFCKEVEVFGEVLHTPGHTDDSVTFLTRDSEALIGDLYPVNQIMPDDHKSLASWKLIGQKGARVAYPSHAGVIEMR